MHQSCSVGHQLGPLSWATIKSNSLCYVQDLNCTTLYRQNYGGCSPSSCCGTQGFGKRNGSAFLSDFRRKNTRSGLQQATRAASSIGNKLFEEDKNGSQPQTSSATRDRMLEHCTSLLRQGKHTTCLTVLRQLNWQNNGEYVVPVRDAVRWMQYIARACKPAVAIQLLQQLPPEPRMYHALMQAYGKKKHLQGIQKAASALAADRRVQQSQAEVGRYTLLNVVKAYGMAGRPDLSYYTFRSAAERGYGCTADVDLCNALINAYENDVTKALARYHELVSVGFQGDLVTLNTLLKCCMRCKDASSARYVMSLLHSAGLEGDEYTWNTLVKVYSYSNDLSALHRLSDEVTSGQLSVSPVVWASLVMAFGSAGHLESAFGLWQTMKGMGVPRSADQYASIMHAAVKGGQAERALRLFDEMRDEGVAPTTVTYNIAIKACGAGATRKKLHATDADRAFDLLADLRGRGVSADLITYTSLLDICAQAADGARAWALYNNIVEVEGMKVDVELCTACIKALGRGGLVKEALEVFGSMVWGPARMRPTQVTFLTLIRLCRENGVLDDALRVYQGMRKAGFPPDNREFQLLMSAAAEATLGTSATTQAPYVLCGNFLSGDVLDLHGMSVMEARAAVLCVLKALQVHHKRGFLPRCDLVIITGSGQHSGSSGPRIRHNITRLLQQELNVPLDTHPATSSSGSRPAGEPVENPTQQPSRTASPPWDLDHAPTGDVPTAVLASSRSTLPSSVSPLGPPSWDQSIQMRHKWQGSVPSDVEPEDWELIHAVQAPQSSSLRAAPPQDAPPSTGTTGFGGQSSGDGRSHNSRVPWVPVDGAAQDGAGVALAGGTGDRGGAAEERAGDGGAGVPSASEGATEDGTGVPSALDSATKDGTEVPSALDSATEDGTGAPLALDGATEDGMGVPAMLGGVTGRLVRPSVMNPGRVVVTKEALCAWLRAKSEGKQAPEYRSDVTFSSR